MFCRTMSVMLLLSVVFSPTAQAFSSDDRVGWKAHDQAFYEVGYVYEKSAWATRGLQDVRLSGVRFHEHRGLLSNGLILLLFHRGGPFEDIVKGVAGEATKTMGMNVETSKLEKQRDDLLMKIWDDAAPPLSMDLQFFSAEFGSEMTGIIGEIGLSGSYMLVDDVFVALWTANFTASWLWANHLFIPSPGLETPVEEIERRWIGLSFSGRLLVPDFEYVGLLGRFMMGYSENPLVLLEFGPEVSVGDRLLLRGLAAKDFGSGAALSARFEFGVRF